MVKRVFLFLAVNLLVMFTISIVLSVLGVGRYMTANGIDYTQLAAFCLVWGMGGSFISLLLSKVMAKWTMGVQIIDENTRDPVERELLQTVHDYARKAGITGMPEVGIYPSAEINAFATGPTKNSSLVALSAGLLRTMGRSERNGVISHEIAHIANGDMVTLTLIQGVVNAFAMFLARALAWAISSQMRRDDDRSSGFLNFALVMVFQMVFTLLGSMVVAWFSRWREYRADAGGAEIGGKADMIRGLERLRGLVERSDDGRAPAMAAMKISSKGAGFMALLSTHPPLEDRIAALRNS